MRGAQWSFGDIQLDRLIESEVPLLSPYEIFEDCERAHIDSNLGWLAPRFYDVKSELLAITIQSFVIRRNGRIILVDTCSGDGKTRARPFFDRRTWPWMDRLRALGIEPQQVDIVMCTHLHVDHVGWNTRLENGRWVPTFPNARYLIAEKEWAYWRRLSESNGLMRTGDYIADSVLPVVAAGQVDLVGDEFRIDGSIWLEPTPGHTPGHFALHLDGGGKEAILSGDLMHHPLQIRYPDWSTRFCADGAGARETRRKFFQTYAGSDTLILPSHFPTPTGIFLERWQDRPAFRYCDEDYPITLA